MFGSKPAESLVAIVGSTGSGKSQLAVDLALRHDGEVINSDAMQMYHGLPIITNKISTEEQKGVPHHILGCVDVHQTPWTVTDFVKQASKVIEDIHFRKRLPILVGGTHYYLHSLLFYDSLPSLTNSGPGVESSDNAQAEIDSILDAPTSELHARLRDVDPAMADRWHPNDRRKIARSLEICLRTGRRASELYAEQLFKNKSTDAVDLQSSQQGLVNLKYPTLFLWTHTPKESLDSRLNERVQAMIANGLVDEVKLLMKARNSKKLLGQALDHSRGIWVSVGFKEFCDYCDAIDQGNVAAVELDSLLSRATGRTQAATRQYAKSQIKWIRIKLLNALRNAGAEDKIFVLDTRNAPEEDWDRKIVGPASGYVRAFLTDSNLPDPREESQLAQEVLQPKRDYDLSQRQDLWKTRTCTACNVTAVTDSEWEKHVKSQGHRKALKSQQKRDMLKPPHGYLA